MILPFNLPESKQSTQGIALFLLIVVLSLVMFFTTESNYSLFILLLSLPNYFYWSNQDIQAYKTYASNYNQHVDLLKPSELLLFIEQNYQKEHITCQYLKAYLNKYHPYEAQLNKSILQVA